MLTDAEYAALEAAWAPARAAGVLGSAPLEALVEHTAGFARAVCSSFSAETRAFEGHIVDVGTGAGLPGAILAALLPSARFTLIDASERRLDHARRAARALGVSARVSVVHGRADELGRTSQYRETGDVAVARLLADPAETLEQLLPLVRDRGWVIVATAGDAVERWEALPVPSLPSSSVTWHADEPGRFAAVQRTGALDPALPRREKVRRRSPAF